MSKMFGWDSHKKLDRYYEEKDKIARAKSNVEKLREEQAKAEETMFCPRCGTKFVIVNTPNDKEQ